MAYLEVLPYLCTTGQQQMALDRWLLTRFCDGAYGAVGNLAMAMEPMPKDPKDKDSKDIVPEDTMGCLRFYGWQPHALSLGCHQRQLPNHWQDLCARRGLDLVQRPSGGRAVLHGGDLTYALVIRLPHALESQSRRQIYEWLCGFLIAGLAESGIRLNFGNAVRSYRHHPSCFATATAADLVLEDGRKLIGSAQVYRQSSHSDSKKETFVLQHGSIVLQPDYDLLVEIFGEPTSVAGLLEILPQYTLTKAIDLFPRLYSPPGKRASS